METSLADIAAVTRNNDDGWCGGNGLWLFAILALMGGGFGNWGNRGYGNGFEQYTSAQTQEILFGQQFQGVNNNINQQGMALDNKVDRVGNGIADLGYALQGTINGVQSNLGGAITNEGRAIQMQLAECCCDNKAATAQVRYDMANLTAATQQAIHAEGEATRNMLQQNKIEAMQSQINQLQLQSAMCGVMRYPQAMTYNAPNPFCGCNNGGCNGNNNF